MRLASWAEIVFDTQMYMNVARSKPPASTGCERLWLLQDREAEDIAVESVRIRLPAHRHGELNVIESDDPQ